MLEPYNQKPASRLDHHQGHGVIVPTIEKEREPALYLAVTNIGNYYPKFHRPVTKDLPILPQ